MFMCFCLHIRDVTSVHCIHLCIQSESMILVIFISPGTFGLMKRHFKGARLSAEVRLDHIMYEVKA
jgi:hypothetical protein